MICHWIYHFILSLILPVFNMCFVLTTKNNDYKNVLDGLLFGYEDIKINQLSKIYLNWCKYFEESDDETNELDVLPHQISR